MKKLPQVGSPPPKKSMVLFFPTAAAFLMGLGFVFTKTSIHFSLPEKPQTKEQLCAERPGRKVTVLLLFDRTPSQGSAEPGLSRCRIKTPQPREQNGRPAGFPHRAETRRGELRKGAPLPSPHCISSWMSPASCPAAAPASFPPHTHPNCVTCACM